MSLECHPVRQTVQLCENCPAAARKRSVVLLLATCRNTAVHHLQPLLPAESASTGCQYWHTALNLFLNGLEHIQFFQ